MRRLLSCLALALLAGSCSTQQQASSPVFPTEPPLAQANTPVNSTHLVLGCWGGSGLGLLGGLLTDDYTFGFAMSDSAGNAYRTRPWIREDELISAQHLLLGGGPHPRARHVRVAFDSPLTSIADPRPGMDPHWHKLVRTATTLTLTEDWFGRVTERIVEGHASFYLVRGDSAVIPAELVAQGWRPDSTRWWLERWEDETVPGVPDEGPGSLVRHTSWGQLKSDYR